MKQFIKEILDRHPWARPMARQKQHKVPKKSAARKGTRSAARMQADREMKREI